MRIASDQHMSHAVIYARQGLIDPPINGWFD